jgi:hypothetical protein
MAGEKPNPSGLTKREYFAALAMQGMLSKPNDIDWLLIVKNV